MALEADIKGQLAQYLELLEQDIVLEISLDSSENSNKMKEFVAEIAAMSAKISMQEVQLARTPSFQVTQPNQQSGVVFAGIPLGHEFTSLVLALLQVSGRPPKIENDLVAQIKKIDKKLAFETYVSLTCHNCPDVVQALNIMSVLNPNISHTMIEGGMFKEEVEANEIMAVPAVFLNGEFFESGRTTLEDILAKVGEVADPTEFTEKEPFDVLVIGGGPAGSSAAIYAARKGIRTGLLAETFGGQVMETLGIENIIGTKYTEGPKFMASVEEHVNEYPVDVMKAQKVVTLEKKDFIEATLENGGVLKSKTVVLALGARWRDIGVPGEKEFKTKGVAYCPHCDGPLFAGKEVAVVGGGNSGIEAAIDLAGIVKHVTVLEFLPELKADQVLQERVAALPNVTVLKNVQTKEITGDTKVNGLTYIDRETNQETHIDLAGVFIQIGLVPNTAWLGDTLEKTRMGELVVNKHGETSLPGVFAAGDCTDSAYKQIIISMGSGATAALGAFDYLIRNK
ncbi:alkyl hydroperoxide reductase subunit F [Enterococcus sp. PF1-24]|uniref:alkyl hydroperoxide reductase subunit F n=1 Tax=unclassified Enterococcus TaxID=2608891 RepID=UPI002474ABCA|nr:MULTISPECIES: alkyl hydroperoxide reductase subunit F [unclassified Enterococcus]MDH6363813.1 alkyl hydroperoxide reductase subunit F [Enterococcus sp. PFB1-1]MDH6401001.1 alkyl hydroperoxide reductase subunit F [Enterococcus sp. PF1-24]